MTHRAAERSDARQNRERIVRAAYETFAERGVGVEVREIAERAGVGVGTFYRNFATKDELIIAIIGDVIARFDAVMADVLEIDDPVEAIQVFLARILDVLETWGEVCRGLLRQNLPAGVGEQFMGFVSDPRIEDVFQRGIDRGIFRADLDPVLARGLLYACCDPLVYIIPRQSRSPDEIVAGFTDLVLRSFMAGAPPA